jgi:hypothetical protein
MHYSNSVSYKFKMNIRVKNSITNNFTNCIVHAKQSEITRPYWNISKQWYIPMLGGEVCCLLQYKWSLMATLHSGVVKWVKWCVIAVQNKTFDRIWYSDMESGWLQKTKVHGNISDYHFSLWNVDNYQFRSLFKIGNMPPMNRRSVDTKTFSVVIQNS